MFLKRKASSADIVALEQALRSQVRAVSEAAAKQGGQVSAEQMESIRRLRELLQMRRSWMPLRQRRWLVIATLVVTLLVASLLYFVRMPSADIEMDIRVSEIGLRLARPQRLWNVMGVTAVRASGLNDIELPIAAGVAGRGDRDSEFQLEVESDGQRSGVANLAPVALPTGAWVRLQKTSVPHEYRLSLPQTKGVEIRADAIGPVAISLPGSPRAHFDFAVPQSVGARSGPDESEVSFILSRSPTPEEFLAVSVAELTVARVEQYSDGAQSIARHVSTVMSGTIYFEALGIETKLRPAEEVLFDSAKGEIRTLELEDNDIAVRFHGQVTGMSSGFEENTRSIMPTLLEWLRARHGLSLLWGAAVYLFALGTAVLRWWGID